VRNTAALSLACLAALAVGCSGGPVVRDRPELLAKAEAEFDAAVEMIVGLQYKAASAKFPPLVHAFDAAGRPARAAEAGFWLGYCHEKLGEIDKARKQYASVARRYPDARAAERARARLARLE